MTPIIMARTVRDAKTVRDLLALIGEELRRKRGPRGVARFCRMIVTPRLAAHHAEELEVPVILIAGG
jgi:hypothetical protein